MANTKILTRKPVHRKLRGFAFDPSLSLNLDTVGINEILYTIPWEDLEPGPEGEYIKVIDRDPPSDAIYLPVDLDEIEILAQDGLTPSVSNPQFHQQMVYAVVMNTIINFEKALGRKVLWNALFDGEKNTYIQKLLVFPHASRDMNAYYEPNKRVLLFGYFNADASNPSLQMPDSIVFSCLSHDIIAHETTHAILDGISSYYMDTTNLDIGAFHEAFADIVALFQHFSFPEALKHQLARSRGRFNAESLLSQLANEFGIAMGTQSPLRDFLGEKNEYNVWKVREPDPQAYQNTLEPHDRGAILVAAVFHAFINIYNSRTSDLIRIATNGSGELPAGNLNPDLVNRLASEASKTASHILSMCIRALDYCPPIDINFGDYLRALITADADLVAFDDRQYRIAFIESFRQWGIFPEGIQVLSEEALIYNHQDEIENVKIFNAQLIDFLHDFKTSLDFETDRKKIYDETRKFVAFDPDREVKGLHHYFLEEFRHHRDRIEAFESLTGLILSSNYKKLDIETSDQYSRRRRSRQELKPTLEINSVRLNNRVGPNSKLQSQVIITLVQKCYVEVLYDADQETYDVKTYSYQETQDIEGDYMIFRGGCTLIFDLDTNELKHAISKPIMDMDAFHARRKKYRVNTKRAILQFECEYGDYAGMLGFSKQRKKGNFFKSLHQSKMNTHGKR